MTVEGGMEGEPEEGGSLREEGRKDSSRAEERENENVQRMRHRKERRTEVTDKRKK